MELEGFGGYIGWRAYGSIIGPSHTTPVLGISYNNYHVKIGQSLAELSLVNLIENNTFHSFGIRYTKVTDDMIKNTDLHGTSITLVWDYNF